MSFAVSGGSPISSITDIPTGGILSTKPLDYYQCHRYLVPPGFHPVDGAKDRACRGASVDDNLAEHYLVVQGVATAKECSSTLIFRVVS